jgi:hypothetical protein
VGRTKGSAENSNRTALRDSRAAGRGRLQRDRARDHTSSVDRSTRCRLIFRLWHDINGVTVFQWNDDGSELIEQTIADTGGHHPTSGAGAIVRGMSPDFVIALLGAHDPPQQGTSFQRLVNYSDSATLLIRTLQALAPEYSIDPASQPARFNLFRNTVFSQLTDMPLYGFFLTGGSSGVKAQIDASVDLAALAT